MQWYYSEGGLQRGPVNQDQLLAMLGDARLKAQDLVWREGMGQWLPVVEIRELREALLPPGAPPLPPSAAPMIPMVPRDSAFQAPVIPIEPGVVPNYIGRAILLTLLGCMPFGIAAVVFASRVDGLAASGDLAAAEKASKRAKTWCWVAFWTGLVWIALFLSLAYLASNGR